MGPYYSDAGMTLYHGDVLDVLRQMPDESVQCVVTSPPYWGLRDYGTPGQLGLEPTPDEYVANMVAVFAEVRRVLRTDGTCWLNLGDSYAGGGNGGGGSFAKDGIRKPLKGSDKNQRPAWKIGGNQVPMGLKPKDLVGIPWRVAFALQADGWWLRSDIIWAKPNPMPESVSDRPTKAHEYLFLLTKSSRYKYDAAAIADPSNYLPGGSYADVKEGGFNDKGETPGSGQRSFRAIRETRNKRSVWTVATQPYSEAHFATFPPKLIEPCILAGSKPGDVVLDPFIGSGTTALVAQKHRRKAVGIDINADYLDMAIRRNAQKTLWFTEAAS